MSRVQIVERHPFACWFVVYATLAMVVTFPLVLRLTSTVADGLGDALLSTTLLWWNAHAMPLTERWWNGFAFFPASGMMAFSDHRLGESLLATPLQWLGCSAPTAYNLTLLATFPLCAIAAHALAFVLTRRHDAAALCGLAYGFNPYRVTHLAHLELLAAFGMPAALAALHLSATRREPRWMVAFAAALIVQGLCTSYYIAFFAVLLLLWLLWFVRWRDSWLLLALLVAGLCVGVVLSPLAIGYSHIHVAYGMSRSLGEILTFSADVTSLVTATGHSALWGWTSGLNPGERQLFPGLVIIVLVLVGVLDAVRTGPTGHGRRNWVTVGLSTVAAVYTGVAFSTKYFGPWRVQIGPLPIVANVFFKPMSVAVATGALAVAASTRGRDAWRRRSLLAFYVVATVIMFICSFGPKPTFLGEQVLYKPPYAWLMRLPVFATEIRAPARFAMLAILTLSVAGALAFDRLRLPMSARRIVAGALMLGIVADGWIREIRLPPLPELLPVARVAGFDSVLELPLGDEDGDESAMYRATAHKHPVVNGASGYLPSEYEALAAALGEQDDTALDALAPMGKLLVTVNNHSDPHHFWSHALQAGRRAMPLGGDDSWSFFALTPTVPLARCGGTPLPIVRAFDDHGAVDVNVLTDGNPATFWDTPAQYAGTTLVLDLGESISPCLLVMSIGPRASAFPRSMSVATSTNRLVWTTNFSGSTSAEAVRAAIAQPTNAALEFALPATPTRFIRLRLETSSPAVPWLVSDILVRGTPLAR